MIYSYFSTGFLLVKAILVVLRLFQDKKILSTYLPHFISPAGKICIYFAARLNVLSVVTFNIAVDSAQMMKSFKLQRRKLRKFESFSTKAETPQIEKYPVSNEE